ncbi:FV3-083R, partial [Symbiodinium sp. KB8]
AKMAVYKVRIADAFLSTDRGRNLYWQDQALGTLNSAQLPVESSDAELRDLFPNGPGYPQGAGPTSPQSINLLGGSYVVFLRCRELGNAAHILGPLGTDIICKVIIDKGVGHVMKDQTDEGHLVELRGPITLRTLHFRLTDVDGAEVNTRGTSVSFAIFLDPDKAPDAVPATVPTAKKRGRPPGSKNKPKPPPATVPADPGPSSEPLPKAAAPAPEPKQPEPPRHPVHLRRPRCAWCGRSASRTASSSWPRRTAWTSKCKGTMMSLERRNEPQMLQSFWKQFPSYKARAFNEWLENRRLRKEGEEYTDAVGRLTETVNRRIPQLRYAPAERAGVRRAARDVAAGRNTQESFGGVRPDFGQVLGYIQEGEPINLELPKRNASVYMAEAFEAEVDEGYRGQPFPQPPREMLRQRSFFSDSSSDFGAADPAQALRMDGFDAASPQIIGRPSEVEPLLERAGQRAAVEEGRAIQDMEAFMHGQVAEAEAEGFASAAEAAVSGAEAAAAAEVGGGALAAASEAALGVAGAAGAAAGGLAVAGAAAALVGTAWAIEGGLTAASHLMGWGGAAGSGTDSDQSRPSSTS